METIFQRACRLVDTEIRRSGAGVSAVERNKRVQAAEFNLRNGVPATKIDTRSQITTLSVGAMLQKVMEEDNT